MPKNLPVAVPSSVTITVECPVVLLNCNTSFSDVPDFTFESLITKPALCFFTWYTIVAWSSIDCEPNINARPPSLASATPILSPETDCIIADTIGMFAEYLGSSPLLNFTSGVFNDTFDGIHFSVVKFGNNKNSLNVLEMSGNIIAMFFPPSFFRKNDLIIVVLYFLYF